MAVNLIQFVFKYNNIIAYPRNRSNAIVVQDGSGYYNTICEGNFAKWNTVPPGAVAVQSLRQFAVIMQKLIEYTKLKFKLTFDSFSE